MSKINNGGLDQYGAEPFEQQQFGPAGVAGVNKHLQYFAWTLLNRNYYTISGMLVLGLDLASVT